MSSQIPDGPWNSGILCRAAYRGRAWTVLCAGAFAFVLVFVAAAAPPVMRVVKANASAPSLLRNGNFELQQDGKFSDWSAAPKGLNVATGQGRNGTAALGCDNRSAADWTGASQTLVLNRSNTAPLIVRGWSKADSVSGSPDSGYSLYVDLVYQDGTPLWGQTANFRTGTHDWQERELLILPQKPIKTLTLYCLFRGHTGKCWFDDVMVSEVNAGVGTLLFEGVPVTLETLKAPASGSRARSSLRLATKDGLALRMDSGNVQSLRLGSKELAGIAPSGFLARDVAAGSDFYGFSGGTECPDLGLSLQADFKAETSRIVVQGRVTSTSLKDRAITLLFALPLDLAGWRWGDDIRQSRAVGGSSEFINVVNVGCGATGTMSLYPLAAVYGDKEGVALGMDMGQPVQYRLAYHGGTRQLYIAYDFGLVRETDQFPNAGDFRFVIFRFDPEWGFRAAFEKYTKIFPDYFRVRSTEQGIWMPFTDVSKVEGWQDFGFRYHEGNNNVPWDDEHGVLSFRYTEPMTWWMRMEKELPRTAAEAIRIRDELARSGRGNEAHMAQVSETCAMWDDSGQPALSFQDTPWCNGAVWSLNPNPALPGRAVVQDSPELRRFNAATVHWNQAVKQSLYGLGAKGKQDGEYLDSLEGYVTTDLNFRREHFRYTTVPLTFARDTREPALWKGLAVYEFTRWISQDVHSMGKLMFANGVPYRLSFLCPWLDVLGTETDWLSNGKYRPVSDSQMCLWRTMSGAKPYLLLMNTDYGRFSTELVQKYFQRSLFYGMFPSMFSHNAADNPYWQSPKWYGRDRELFKKYIPLVKRVAEAGWQPLTVARCDNSRIYVERYGPDPAGTLYITLLNDTDTRQSGKLRLNDRQSGAKSARSVTELISNTEVQAGEAMEVSLEPQEAKLMEMKPGR